MLRGQRISKILEASVPREGVVVSGWARSIRQSKNVAFIMLNDGSCHQSLQVVFEASAENFDDVVRAGTGAALRVTGTLVVPR